LILDVHQIDVLPWMGLREPFNSFSHLIGAAVFSGLAPHFVRLAKGDWARTASLVVLVYASVQQLLVSGIYHAFWPGPVRDIFLRGDVDGVFILIAASMTPGHVILFRGIGRWGSLLLIWGFALGGILWRTLSHQGTPGAPGIALFLLFGWGSVVTAVFLWRRFGWSFIQPAAIAGLSYTIGAIVLVLHRPVLIPGVIGAHEIWHVAVLMGIAFQWYFVSQFADGHVLAINGDEDLTTAVSPLTLE
jgi:hemolysin III